MWDVYEGLSVTLDKVAVAVQAVLGTQIKAGGWVWQSGLMPPWGRALLSASGGPAAAGLSLLAAALVGSALLVPTCLWVPLECPH